MVRYRHFIIVLCCVCLHLWEHTTTVWAQDAQKTPSQYKVGLFPFQSISRSLPKQELNNLSWQVVQQFEQTRIYPVVRKYPLTGGSAPSASQEQETEEQRQKKAMAPLYQQLNQVASLVQQANYDQAVPRIQQAIKLAQSLVKWSGSITTLARLRGLLALTYLKQGKNEEGESTLQELARMDPQPLPPEIEKNPIMRSLYRRAVQELTQGSKSRLQILGTPQGHVYVNGKNRGQIPVDLSDLPSGVHYVRVEKANHHNWGKAVLLTQTLSQLQVNLQAIPPRQISAQEQAAGTVTTQLLLQQWDSVSLKDAVSSLCQDTGIQFLLAGLLKKVGDQHYLFTPISMDCQKTTVKLGEKLQLNTDLLDVDGPIYRAYLALLKAQTQQQKVAVITPERRPPVLPPTQPPGTTPTGSPVYQKWWFWTLITVGVAGAAAATTTVILLNQPPKISVKADWSTLQ